MTTEIGSSNGRKSWTETPPTTPLVRRVTGEMVASQDWLDQLAEPVQGSVQKFYGASWLPGGSFLKRALNGTWLGHPLHPLLTDIPIGSWTTTLLFDGIWLLNKNEGTASAADTTLVLGLAGAGAAAVAGLTDWSDTDGTDRRMGLLHGLLNSLATTLNLGSWFLRRAGRRRTGIALSVVGYLLMSYSADLGGELSYAKGIGVNHTAYEGGSDDYVAVLAEKDLPEQKLTRVEAAGVPVVLFKQAGTIYAIAATCSHLGGPLDEGTVENCVVTCPWHGSSFRLSDGSVVNSPAVYAQPTFGARVRNGQIELRRLVHA